MVGYLHISIPILLYCLVIKKLVNEYACTYGLCNMIKMPLNYEEYIIGLAEYNK